VLNAHDHDYERFAPQTPAGLFDPEIGLREFVVGTGGRSHYAVATPIANSEVTNSMTFGVLALTLHDTGYDWRFVPEAGAAFDDSGTQDCHWAPANRAAPAITGTPQDGQVLSASTGDWSAGPQAELTYAWRRCDLEGVACRGIAGATGPTYKLTSADVGSRIRVRVYAANALGSTYEPSPPTGVVAAAAPVNWRMPVISGTLAEGATLTTDNGGWAGTKPITFAYLWRRCDAKGLICRTIADATTSSYQLTADDVGSPLRVRVYATNAAGTVFVPSRATAPVAAAAPEAAAGAAR
jgi:hypothetical protein